MTNESPYQFHEAEIVERIDEAQDIFTLRLRLTDQDAHAAYQFQPGQFNMLYAFGVGEAPISIVSDPEHDELFDHTIRKVGRVTQALAAMQPGDRIGIRGPFGRGWPVQQYRDSNFVIVTGGLGCAPSVSIIRYILRRREQYGSLNILQGVKKSHDLIWRKQYQQWEQQPDTHVYLAADVVDEHWPWHQGPVTRLFDEAQIHTTNSVAMMCGPERMMVACADELQERGFEDNNIWLSMERNMQCAIGKCGHCQFGPHFVCRNGPVFSYDEVRDLIHVKAY